MAQFDTENQTNTLWTDETESQRKNEYDMIKIPNILPGEQLSANNTNHEHQQQLLMAIFEKPTWSEKRFKPGWNLTDKRQPELESVLGRR